MITFLQEQRLSFIRRQGVPVRRQDILHKRNLLLLINSYKIKFAFFVQCVIIEPVNCHMLYKEE